MSAEEEDRLDFGEDDDDRESEISLGFGGEGAGENDEALRGDSAMRGVQETGMSYEASDRQAGADAVTAAVSEAPQDSGRPLPEGWTRRTSRKGEIYYLNTVTNQSTWDEPTEPATAGIEESGEASRQTSEKPVSSEKEASSTAIEDESTTANDVVEDTPANKESLTRKNGSAISLASAILRSDREDGETDSEKDPNSPAIAAILRSSEQSKTGEIPTGPARKRGPLPPQNQAFSRKGTLAQLSQPPIEKPPQGPSADARMVAALARESRQGSAPPSSKPNSSTDQKAASRATSDRKEPKAEHSASSANAQAATQSDGRPDNRNTSEATGKAKPATASLPTGPKADRQPPSAPRGSRPASVQISRSLSGGNGPPTAPPSLAGVPKGPAASRIPPRQPQAQTPSTAPLPRQPASSRQGPAHRQQASVDNGWPSRKVSTTEGTTGPAPSPEAARDTDIPSGPRKLVEATLAKETRSKAPPGMKSDSGWGKRAMAPASADSREKDAPRRSRTPPPRPRSPRASRDVDMRTSPPPYRQSKPLPSQADVVHGGRSGRRERSLTPPRYGRRRSATPPPRRRTPTPPPRRRNETPPLRRRDEPAPARRRGDSPPPRRVQEPLDRQDRGNSRPRQDRAISPPRDIRRRLPSPPPARRRSPSPIPLRRRRSPSLPERRTAPSLLSRLGDRRDASPPPAKRSRNDPYESRDMDRRRSGDRMEIDGDEDRRRGQTSRGRSSSPARNGNSSLTSSRGKAKLGSALEAPADDEDAPIVDITAGLKIDDEVLKKTVSTGAPLIRLYNPEKGTSVDARAFIAVVKERDENSTPADTSTARVRSVSHNSPFPAGIAGLPPKPAMLSEDSFRNARNVSLEDAAPASTVIIDSYRPGMVRKDSRNVPSAYRQEGKRGRSRSPEPNARGGGRTRSPPRDRDHDGRRDNRSRGGRR